MTDEQNGAIDARRREVTSDAHLVLVDHDGREDDPGTTGTADQGLVIICTGENVYLPWKVARSPSWMLRTPEHEAPTLKKCRLPGAGRRLHQHDVRA
jgi:hypothetical protein